MSDFSHDAWVVPVSRGGLPAFRGAKRLSYRLPRWMWRSNGLAALAFVLLLLTSFVSLMADQAIVRSGWSLWLANTSVDNYGGPIGFALLFGTLAARRLRPFGRSAAHGHEDLARAVALLPQQPNASAGLVRLGDKRVLLSDCGRAFIMYARQGRSLVALFDPVGDVAAWRDLVVKFEALARQDDCRVVFYQVSPQFLPIAAEFGYSPRKLGEQAVLDLTRFDTKGGDWVKLRRSINRAERDGLQFSMIPAESVGEVMSELAAVSDQWLAQHNAAEKGFSLGTFRPDYIRGEPVAVIRIEGRIVAFASILTSASDGDAFIDLMRHVPGTHRGMMDLLFVRIMETLKAQGFRTLNLGMAPLAGLSDRPGAPLWNRLGKHIFENGERFYNFRGVLAFKSKFDPQWQPRYLVSSGSGLPLVALLDVTMLIGGGLKGVLKR